MSAAVWITPLPDSDPVAVEKVREMWRRCGSMIETLDPATHDRVVAIVSHLPHMIAFTICGTADDLAEETKEAVLKFAASGFRDFTRIAASDPTMWRDVFLNNRDAVLEMLGRFNEDLAALQRAIRWGDGDALFNHFTRTRAIRRSIIEQGQDTAAPDFGRHAADETKP
jgi:cyclohexadieny/prephenate dehydrogenase